MGKFRDILIEADVIYGDQKTRVPTDSRGRPLSVSMQRMIKATQQAQGQSGFKLRKSLEAILNQMREFEKAVKELPKGSNGFDSVKFKVRKDFSQSMTDLGNMIVNLKKKGLQAVESKNEDMELWENLETSCHNITHWMKNSSFLMVDKNSDKS